MMGSDGVGDRCRDGDGARVIRCASDSSSFENKATAVETVTPMRDPDGLYRVSGYFIR